MDDAVWVPTVFTKNRQCLIEHDAVIELFNRVLAIAQNYNWLSGEHFSVDGTLIQAWVSHKGFVRKDGQDGDGATSKARGVATTPTSQVHMGRLLARQWLGFTLPP